MLLVFCSPRSRVAGDGDVVPVSVTVNLSAFRLLSSQRHDKDGDDLERGSEAAGVGGWVSAHCRMEYQGWCGRLD